MTQKRFVQLSWSGCYLTREFNLNKTWLEEKDSCRAMSRISDMDSPAGQNVRVHSERDTLLRVTTQAKHNCCKFMPRSERDQTTYVRMKLEGDIPGRQFEPKHCPHLVLPVKLII